MLVLGTPFDGTRPDEAIPRHPDHPLIDRFGASAAVGRKAAPGPLYGISRDVWPALAIAITYTLRDGSVDAA